MNDTVSADLRSVYLKTTEHTVNQSVCVGMVYTHYHWGQENKVVLNGRIKPLNHAQHIACIKQELIDGIIFFFVALYLMNE